MSHHITVPGTLFVVSAPSGAGKTSLSQELLQRVSSLTRAVTTTTRPMRQGEVNGRDYYFVTPEVFKQKIADGEFLEHAEVFSNLYGLTKAEVQEKLALGQNILVILDVQGAKKVMAEMEDQVVSAEELKNRLVTRGENNDDDLQQRLAAAQSEIFECGRFDYIVVNEMFDNAVKDMQSIVHAHQLQKDKVHTLQTLAASFLTC